MYKLHIIHKLRVRWAENAQKSPFMISKFTHVNHSDIMFTICTLSFGYGFCSKGEQWGSSKVWPFLPSRTVTSSVLLVPFGVPGFWLLIYSYPLAEWGLLEAGENCCNTSESESHSLCLTLCDPRDYTVHRILQARILEWIAYPFSGALPDPGIEPGLLHCRQILYQLSW